MRTSTTSYVQPLGVAMKMFGRQVNMWRRPRK